MRDEPRRPPIGLFRMANHVVRPLLRSPLHGLLSGRLMLLAYRGRRTGQEHTIPIGYFALGDDVVIAFSSARWWVNLLDGRPVRVRLRGRWHDAVPTVATSTEDRAALLAAFVRRYGPRRAGRLPLGLPGDREPTTEELQRGAARMPIIRLTLTRPAGR